MVGETRSSSIGMRNCVSVNSCVVVFAGALNTASPSCTKSSRYSARLISSMFTSSSSERSLLAMSVSSCASALVSVFVSVSAPKREARMFDVRGLYPPVPVALEPLCLAILEAVVSCCRSADPFRACPSSCQCNERLLTKCNE